MHKKQKSNTQSGNALVTSLIVIAVLAIAGFAAYSSGLVPGMEKEARSSTVVGQQPTQQSAENTAPDIMIKPGNPVVAKVGDQDVTRIDVFNFIQTLPPQTRQMPIAQLFPVALEQVVANVVINKNTEGVNLDSDPEVKKQLEQAKKNIVRNVYLEKQVDAKITDERVQAAYEVYKAGFPKVEEVRVRHILVKDEAEAKDLITQLSAGADFAELAKANSEDDTGKNGGELGYFTKGEGLPEFAEAAFSAEIGTFSKTPVETKFGYHVIDVQDKRLRPPAELEEAKPFLEAQLRQIMLNEVVQEWKSQSSIQRFDINGDPVVLGAHDHDGEAPHSH